jgi:hypothetical protein
VAVTGKIHSVQMAVRFSFVGLDSVGRDIQWRRKEVQNNGPSGPRHHRDWFQDIVESSTQRE